MYIQTEGIKPAFHFYEYDALNRIKKSYTFEKQNFAKWKTGADVLPQRYQTEYQYDEAGNLDKLSRKGKNGAFFDKFSYNYNIGTNQLNWVDDAVGNGVRTDDMDKQDPNNYVYDADGRVLKDNKKGVK